ncbi:MAG: YajD family HNH nuclease [Mariprofundaceae bacterium]
MPIKPSNYREQALKLFPWVCGHCGRDFGGKQLKELTVHHKDHNHDNNPPDGSNWELLCVYCHDHEHSKMEDASWLSGDNEREEHQGTYNAFAGLEKLLNADDDSKS